MAETNVSDHETLTDDTKSLDWASSTNVSSNSGSLDKSSPLPAAESAEAYVPFALTWTERKLELKPVKTLKGSKSSETTKNILPRHEFTCTAIPGSNEDFILFAGKATPEKDDIWTDNVFHWSTKDMSITEWETNGAKPPLKTGHGAAIVGRVLVVFGGAVDSTYLHFLNLDTNEWSNLRPPAPYPGSRFGHTFVALGTQVWLFGGVLAGTRLDDVWCLDLGTPGIEHVRWRQIPKKEIWPPARSYHGTALHDGCVCIVGGQIGNGDDKLFMNDIWKFDPKTETWSEIKCQGNFPEGRTSLNATAIGDNLFLFGGLIKGTGSKEGENVRADDAYVFNFKDCKWRSLAMMGDSPPPSKRGALLPLGSKLIVIGGQTSKLQRVYVAETQDVKKANHSLARLQFTTEKTQLEFTTDAMDLSQYVRKEGSAAHSLAGFSDVWKGEMTETKEPIAIKVLRVVSTSDPDNPETGRLRTRFDRELTIWMDCQHPRVLELRGYAYIEGVPCLISPWCANGNIMEYLQKKPNADRRKLIVQVAEGLVYLHGRDPPIVHSDIKPANVLVSDEENAKICDFGISKLMQENPSGFTTTASVKGTLRYSSPEMLDLDGMSTTASDVWAFGMLILHVMTGKLPYSNSLSDAKVIMSISGGVKPLREDYPELEGTDPLWAVMEECWREDPAARPGMVDVLRLLTFDQPSQKSAVEG